MGDDCNSKWHSYLSLTLLFAFMLSVSLTPLMFMYTFVCFVVVYSCLSMDVFIYYYYLSIYLFYVPSLMLLKRTYWTKQYQMSFYEFLFLLFIFHFTFRVIVQAQHNNRNWNLFMLLFLLFSSPVFLYFKKGLEFFLCFFFSICCETWINIHDNAHNKSFIAMANGMHFSREASFFPQELWVFDLFTICHIRIIIVVYVCDYVNIDEIQKNKNKKKSFCNLVCFVDWWLHGILNSNFATTTKELPIKVLNLCIIFYFVEFHHHCFVE